mgnify:CR=1 FL=1
MTYSSIFVKFYDSIMGDRAVVAKKIESLILENFPKAKTILDLGCGTGSVLLFFNQRGFKLHGIDISKEMIVEARKKVPNAILSIEDMRHFKLDRNFDVILCLFDSMNHLLSRKDWEMVFNASFDHLNKNGIFIFDINTQHALSILAESSPVSRKFGDNIFTIQVSEQSSGIYDWNITISEKQKNGLYIDHKDLVQETSFSLSTVMELLEKKFSKVKLIDQSGGGASEQSKRVFFICSK